MVSGGQVGEALDWYVLIRAARYLGVPPWELLGRPVFWRDIAIMSESAELEAENARMKHGNKSR